MQERGKEEKLPTLSNVRNVVLGYRDAKEFTGRELIDRGISSYFLVISGAILKEEISPETASYVFRLEDILERQNYAGDEVNNSTTSSPYWEREHFAEEYAGLSTDVYNHLRGKYGEEEGSQRAVNIQDSLERWFKVNEVVEDYLTGRTEENELDDERIRILKLLLNCEEEEKPLVYRDTVDPAWLDTLLVTATDGDLQKVDKLKVPILSITLALQACDDYAFTRRDRRLGKMTLMSSSPYATGSKRLDESLYFLDSLDRYLRQGDLNNNVSSFMKYALVTRGVICRLKARNRGDSKGIEEELFEECNEFERNVNKVISPHMYDLPSVKTEVG